MSAEVWWAAYDQGTADAAANKPPRWRGDEAPDNDEGDGYVCGYIEKHDEMYGRTRRRAPPLYERPSR